MWYRTSFFQKLSEIYDINFVFTHAHYAKDIYGLELSNKSEELNGIKFKLLNNHFGIAFGVINESMGEYDVLVGNSWDSVPEVLEIVMYFVIAKLRGKKIIFWSEDWGWKIKSLKRTLVKYFVKFIVGNSNGIIVPGSKHREGLISIGIPPEKIFIMPNVINFSSKEDLFGKEVAIEKKLNLTDKKIILFVGRLVKQKGVDYLLKAFSRLKRERNDVALVIIGKGELEGELKELAKCLKIEYDVHFLGQIDNNLLKCYYGASEICVIPSITDDTVDAWAFVVNEAMYCGKPVIATDAVGAAFDMIDHGENGFIVPERDVNALYDAMEKIISNPVLMEEMGKKSKKIIETRFKYENMVEGFVSVIDHLKKI